MSPDFDWRSEWREFRQEYREDQRQIRADIEDFQAQLGTIHTRVTVLESMSRGVKWLMMTVIGAIIMAIIGYFKSPLK